MSCQILIVAKVSLLRMLGPLVHGENSLCPAYVVPLRPRLAFENALKLAESPLELRKLLSQLIQGVNRFSSFASRIRDLLLWGQAVVMCKSIPQRIGQSIGFIKRTSVSLGTLDCFLQDSVLDILRPW